jgi:hypothetical protein
MKILKYYNVYYTPGNHRVVEEDLTFWRDFCGKVVFWGLDPPLESGAPEAFWTESKILISDTTSK